jgi:hypothetical protein
MMSFNGLPRYACLKCNVVLETSQQEKGLRCPRCGRKLSFLDIRILNRKQMANLFAWQIFMFGNLAVLGLQAYFIRSMFDYIGLVGFSLVIGAFAYLNYRYARLFKLAWGKSWISETIHARRMVDMTYQQAVEKAKLEQPKMNY